MSTSRKSSLSASSNAGGASYLPLRTVRLREAVALEAAVHQAPNLAQLVQLARTSALYLRLVTPLIAPAMRPAISAGPIEAGQWTVIVANSAVAAKLRQLCPALSAHLRSKGHDVQTIRIQIASARPR